MDVLYADSRAFARPTVSLEVVTPQGTYVDVGTVPLAHGGAAPLNGAVTSSPNMSLEYCAAFCQGSNFFALYDGEWNLFYLTPALPRFLYCRMLEEMQVVDFFGDSSDSL